MTRPFLALFALWAGCAAAQERPSEQPYSAPVVIDAPASHYRFSVPAAAYRGAARRDLGDVRVFNAAGEPVPHAFAPRETQPVPPVLRAASLFPLHGEAGKGVDTTAVEVRRNSRGTVINIRETAGRPASRAVLGYLLDVSAIEERKQALLLEWQAGEGFSGSAYVEGSDDLKQWSSLASGAPVLLLEHAGARLERKRVELAGARAKYLRLSFSGVPRDFVLKEVRVELRGDRPGPVREWLALQAAPGKEQGELLFDTAGRFPVDRLRVSPPQLNTVAQIQLLARDRAEDKWRHVGSATAYRLRGAGGDIVNPDIVLPVSTERYWLLKVDQRGGGFGAGEVRVEAGWLPHEVVFAARGEAPFRFAYGGKSATAGALAIGAVLPGYKEGDLKLAMAARVGNVAGEAAPAPSLLRDPVQFVRGLATSGDGKKWLLWGALVAGVLLLAWMAFRLLGEVSRKDSS
jgi:Protein of unknown function (DUF3999)